MTGFTHPLLDAYELRALDLQAASPARMDYPAHQAAFSAAREALIAALEWASQDPRPIAEARRDGTMYRLLVDYTDGGGPLEDATVAWTIGHNNFDNDGEDVWQFAGWCWSHDHYTQGSGKPTHFLPFENPDPETASPKAKEGGAA